MKQKSPFLNLGALPLVLAIVIGSALFLPRAGGAVEGPPGYVDYQGTVFDGASGYPLGSTGTGPFTAAPTNYTMQFRIYDMQTVGALLWGETQTVTVSLGQFSVRLGAGAPIATDPPPKSGMEIATVFDENSRFLELTVIDAGQTTGTPILPRLAFQSSPFSFVAGRAKVADLADEVNGKVTATAGSTFEGTVTAAAGSTFEGTVTGDVTGNVTGTAANVTGTVAVANGGTGSATQTFVDLSSDQMNIGGTKRFTGNVGIGPYVPSEDLHVTRPHDDIARVYATGVSEGGGMFFAGHDTQFGGGFLSEGSVSPVTSLGGGDYSTTFFRRQGGVNKRVFSYPYDRNDVSFTGDISAVGGITTGGKQVAVGEGNLRIVRGTVNADGTPHVGGGFSSGGSGTYTISMTDKFSAEPSVTVTLKGLTDRKVSYAIGPPPNFDITVQTIVYGTAENPEAHAFSFIAIGPR